MTGNYHLCLENYHLPKAITWKLVEIDHLRWKNERKMIIHAGKNEREMIIYSVENDHLRKAFMWKMLFDQCNNCF